MVVNVSKRILAACLTFYENESVMLYFSVFFFVVGL